MYLIERVKRYLHYNMMVKLGYYWLILYSVSFVLIASLQQRYVMQSGEGDRGAHKFSHISASLGWARLSEVRSIKGEQLLGTHAPGYWHPSRD